MESHLNNYCHPINSPDVQQTYSCGGEKKLQFHHCFCCLVPLNATTVPHIPNIAFLACWCFFLRLSKTGSSSQWMLLFLSTQCHAFLQRDADHTPLLQSELGLGPFPLVKIMCLHIHYYKVHYQSVNMKIPETG